MRLLTLLAGLLLLSTADVASAQLLTFPGAEGVARHVTGGRGGDVYKVTNLNDSGVGSLRYGVQNAPTAGRTIVFDVAGTIQLNSDLSISRSNITIAGQTAPAGGITLAGRQLRVNNTENVVVQFLRVRPGYSDGAGDPDAIWVSGSNGVMLDHITASWGVDETISTTHNSNNVTVQWSTISQALYEGGHSKGDGHSYGSLINGGAYSYHHNLYAHNKSRNPRAQSSGNYLRLDFVNNVLYNPQDRFGYNDSDDPYDMNMVGNYAIKGPKSGSNNSLFDSKDADSHYYVAGNATDINKNGLLDGAAVDGDAVFRSGGAYTLFPTRLSAAQLPEVVTHTASEAYLHVLSRAGAVNYRDPVDRKLIRSVMNQLEGSINTEADIGGLPSLPTGPAPTDSNSDGVPDSFATGLGFAPTTNLAATYAPSGYTYLEEYLHSLTPFAYAPTNTETITISTAHGRGADATVSEAGGTGDGLGGTLNASWAGASGSTNDVAVLKFDLSAIEAGSVSAASLELTAAASAGRSQRFRLYGLEHDFAGWDWDESTIDYGSAPGLVDDGNPGTLGINPASNASNPADIPGVLSLGELSVNTIEEGQTLTFDNPNLGVFVNLAAFFEGAAQEGVATLLLESTTSSGASFYSKEGSAEFAPRLVLEATAAPGLPGDFNSDGVVNAADYTVWRDNSSGEYTPADYQVWASNYGATASGGASVPEPSTCMLLLITSARCLSRRR